MRRVLLGVLGIAGAVACSQPAASPRPPSATPTTVIASPTPMPTSASPSTSPLLRIQVSDGPLTASVGRWVLFQLPSDPRLRAISMDAEQSGVLPVQVPTNTVWSQSPYGSTYAVDKTVYALDGSVIGTLPWPAGQFSWSSDGRSACALTSANKRTGEPLMLQTALIGQSPKTIASGFGIFGDNAAYTVLACDESRDRVIAAAFGQGVAPSKLWVFRLSSGALLRSVDYRDRGTIRWVAASTDGSLVAESEQVGTAATWKATVQAADDGAPQATLDGIVQGFSGDNGLAVVATNGAAAVVEWKTGRRVWGASDVYGGFLGEPSGRHMVVGMGMTGGSDKADVYLVQPDGSARLLPARVRVMLRY